MSQELRQQIENNPELVALARQHGIDLAKAEFSDAELELIIGGGDKGGGTGIIRSNTGRIIGTVGRT